MGRFCLPIFLIYYVLISIPDSEQLCAQQKQQVTTWYVVRHADRDGEKDLLTKAGQQRAETLKELMKTLRVNVVYSTDTKRTRDTAAPTAKALRLSVTTYGTLSKDWFEKIKKGHRGDVVLIVAHSNTAGKIVQGLGGKGDFSIGEHEYDSLFVVTIDKQGSKALRLKFGAKPVSDDHK